MNWPLALVFCAAMFASVLVLYLVLKYNPLPDDSNYDVPKAPRWKSRTYYK